jgi:hypothetical protein
VDPVRLGIHELQEAVDLVEGQLKLVGDLKSLKEELSKYKNNHLPLKI